MSRAPVVLLGMAVAIIGYAVIYNAMSSPELASGRFAPIGFIDSLIPGRAAGRRGRAAATTGTASTATGTASTATAPGRPNRAQVVGGGGGGRPKK